MNRNSLLVVISILLLVETGLSQNLSFQVAGVKRNCILHVPTGISKPAVVFILHGLGGDGAGMQNSTQMDKVADREKFIVAYPSAIGGTWDFTTTKNDYKFLLSIIDTVDAQYHIDRSRIYVAGFSQGGGMTVFIGFQYPDIFAAIAPVSSIGSGATPPKRPIPIFLTYGTGSGEMKVDFKSAVKTWLEYDSCPSTPIVTRPYPSSNPKSTVTRLEYGPCAQNSIIIVDSISGGTHEWPMNTATKVNNSEEVWAFFKKFSLSRTTGTIIDATGLTRKPFSAMYRSGIIHLEGSGVENRIQISDAAGRSVCTAVTKNGQVAFNKNPGIYFLRVRNTEGCRTARIVIPK
ncbi:MAG TPA: PHB depolymerase family esterase [Chitinispirillaceae bacterium]|nr:PHB depolymerase family esterase [Chitinispirillaceae bacterium]